MTQTYNENVVIDGAADVSQLTVQGHTTQNAALQTWKNSAGDSLAQVTADGRIQMGDMSLSTPDALLEAHRDSGSSLPKRGLHTLGRIADVVGEAIAWVVSELELPGSGVISGLHRALRAKLTHSSTGDATAADLRAGDFEAINQSGSELLPTGQLIGVQGNVDNQANAFLTKAYGVAAQVQNGSGANIATAAAFAVRPAVNNGGIDTLIGLDVPDIEEGTENYAIRTAKGAVHIGETLEIAQLAAAPAAKPGVIQLYVLPDGNLYAKNPSNDEFNLIRITGSALRQTTFTIEGDLSVGLNPLRIYNPTGIERTISKVFLSVANIPFGSDIEVDILMDGTSIFTTSPLPTINDGAYTGETTAIDTPAWADGSYLQADIQAVGSGIPGRHLTVHIIYQ